MNIVDTVKKTAQVPTGVFAQGIDCKKGFVFVDQGMQSLLGKGCFCRMTGNALVEQEFLLSIKVFKFFVVAKADLLIKYKLGKLIVEFDNAGIGVLLISACLVAGIVYQPQGKYGYKQGKKKIDVIAKTLKHYSAVSSIFSVG